MHKMKFERPRLLPLLGWRLLLLACLFFGAGRVPATAQTPTLPWQWSNPLPHGNNVYDMAYRAGRYWQVTDRGQIYTSTNRFIWTPLASGVTASLRGIAFLGNQVLVSGQEGVILRGSQAGVFEQATLQPPTTDWLEAVAASDSVAIAVGDNAAIYRSTNGLAWARVGNLPFTDWLRGVAYGGGVFVAVGENGLIATSSDGRQWTKRNSNTTAGLNRVTHSGGVFYAVSENGYVIYSQIPTQLWAAEWAGTTNSLYSFAANNQIQLLQQRVVAGENSLQLKNFGSWTDQLGTGSSLPAPAWSYFAALWDGGRFLVAGRTGMIVESTSSGTGLAWFEEYESPRNWLWDMVRLPDQYVTVGDRATVMTSRNGADWESEFVPNAVTNAVFFGVGGSTNLLVAAGSSGSLMFSKPGTTNIVTTNTVVAFTNCAWVTNTVVSTNELPLLGILWQAVTSKPSTNTLQGVCERDGLVVVVGDNGTVLTTSNGLNWSARTIAGQPDLSSVAPLPTGYVATGDQGVILFSANAQDWSARTSNTTNWVYRVRNLGGTLVAVGENGLILTSPDGNLWTPRASGTTAWLTDAVLTHGRYYISGTQGTVLTSTDLISWSPIGMITGKSLYALAAFEGQLVTAGVEGIILRAATDPVAAITIAAYAHESCPSVSADRFTFRGPVDQTFGLESSADFRTWEHVENVTLGDFVAERTLVRTNAGPRKLEFFRTGQPKLQ